MPKDRIPTAGLGDPYWFEWSIGLQYVLDLLDTEQKVLSVTLQKSGHKGLDDVVVSYSDGQSRYIQVKHTRVSDSLTFGNMVTDGEQGESLLKSMATGWLAAGKPTEVWLVTNRQAGTTNYTSSSVSSISRPPLADFINWLEEESARASELSDLVVNEPKWQDAFEKLWLPELSEIATDGEKLAFLKAFRISHSLPDLSELRDQLRSRLESLFMVPTAVADGLLSKLDSALRVWATSDRGEAEAITKEVAYEKLCLKEDSLLGDHDFPPPAPFFPSRLTAVDEVTALLRDRDAPVIFVTGEPGSGKTALLSYLANQRNPIIDARFHAYRPITPENQLLPVDSQVIKPRTLWTDLLLSLSKLARGRLSQINVPIHAGSLSIGELRDHVLRIADLLGAAEGRPFVIAIDGIDHAARSGEYNETFLSSLIPPDQVPQHVVFLIGGQPSVGYQRQYPAWLRPTALGVKTYQLPRLSLKDTQKLVEARLDISSVLAESTARDVHVECEGHTLSTVFAVEEALLISQNLDELPKRLLTRRLNSGVEGYYKEIWSAATRKTEDGIAQRLACCLVLARSRTTGYVLQSVVDPDRTMVVNWTDLLRKLRPLVLEEADGFRVFHNDFRVFLHGLVQGDIETYKECASLLGNYLLDSNDRLACHAGVQQLYGIAEQHRNQAALYTPQYVLEGYAIGRPLAELTEQAVVAAEALSKIEADWRLAHRVATGLKTLEQLKVSLQWREGLESANTVTETVAAPRAVERRVPAKADWTHGAIQAAMNDILELCDAGETERGRAAFGRWFSGLSPKEVSDMAQQNLSSHQQKDATRALISSLGAASVATNTLLKVSQGKNSNSVEAAYARGVLGSVDGPLVQARDFISALGRIRQCYLDDVESLLWRLIENRNWRLCRRVLRWTIPPDGNSWTYRLTGALTAAILGDRLLQEQWTTPLLHDRNNTIESCLDHKNSGIHEPSQVTLMTRLALLFGITDPNLDSSAIREEIGNAYRVRSSRDKHHDLGVTELLHAAALLGSLIRTTREQLRPAIHCDPTRVARTVSTLTTAIERHPHNIPFGYPQIAALIVDGLLEIANRHNELASAVSESLIDQISHSKPLGPILTPAWRFLALRTRRKELVSYANDWIGSNGLAWDQSVAERHELVTEFASLLQEIDENELAEQALKRLPWTSIGYTGHKEYSLVQPLEWFDELRSVNLSAWETQGLRLFSISREATRTGDNREGRRIETSVLAAACMEGPSSIARVALVDSAAVNPEDDVLLYALVEMLESQTVTRPGLHAIWAFCIGQQCWRVKFDRQVIADVRDACLAAAQRNNITDLDADLRRMGPAEFACEREPDTSSPPSDSDAPDYEAIDPIDAIPIAAFHRDWKRVAAILSDAKSEGGIYYSDCVREAWAALERREEWIWWFDGAHKVYEHLFPLVSPTQRWAAVGRAVRADHLSTEEGRLQTLQDNLDAMCLLVASQKGPEELKVGLDRLLDMHMLWAEGGGNFSSVSQVPIRQSGGLTTWSQVFLRLLVKLMEYDELTYAQSALRGIMGLLKIDPDLLAQLLDQVTGSPGRLLRRFMFIAEAIAAQDHGPHFKEWLTGIMENSPQLDIALSAWSALLVEARSSGGVPGDNDPSWPATMNEHQRILASSPPLIYSPTNQVGLHRSAGRPSLIVLRNLNTACDESVGDVASEFASSIRDEPPLELPSRRRDRSVGDLVLNPKHEAETNRLFEVLRNHERKGRFANVDIGRLLQAVAPAADPFVFLHTPTPHIHTEGWPIDSSLDEKMAGPHEVFENKLAALLNSDLPNNVQMLGGSVTSYSRAWDVKVCLHYRLPPRLMGESEPPTVLNARTSLMLRDFDLIFRPDPVNDWLTWGVGGLFLFIDGAVDVFPSPIWRQLGWQPSPSDPTRWVREGKIVAWHERLSGPIRQIYHGEPIYRQPLLTRWVCTLDEWNRLKEKLGNVEPKIQTKIASYNPE